jgi:hypothetical protein
MPNPKHSSTHFSSTLSYNTTRSRQPTNHKFSVSSAQNSNLHSNPYSTPSTMHKSGMALPISRALPRSM